MPVDFDNREYWIDAVRSFACLCVLTTHAPIPDSAAGLPFVAAFNYFAVGGASILFFMISGALVLYKPKPMLPFLKRRLTRIVFPMVFWTIVCLLITVGKGEIGWGEFGVKVASIPFAPQEGTYWFIYAIFGIYLVTPIMATWLEKTGRRELEFYLGIWAVTLIIPYFVPRFGALAVMLDFSSGVLYYFYGFLWFAVMGYYLRKYVNFDRFRPWMAAVVLAVTLIPVMLYAMGVDHDVIHGRMTIHAVITCCVYFVALKHIHYGTRAKRVFYSFAQHSFGIYLVHILVMRSLLWPILEPYHIHYALQIPLVTLLTAAISYAVVHLISRLPGSKYIVGL